MSYQFAHLETYSRKPNKQGVSTKFVFDEASRREPSACLHVEKPSPPQLVYGMSLDDLEKLHDDRCANAKTVNKTGKEKSIRSDQKTLATVILSYPGNSEPGLAPYQEWEKRSVDWLKKKYGDEFKCAVRHTDEAHPHIHAYILPENPEMKASGFHPGYAAKLSAKEQAKADGKDQKTANKIGDKAYKESMRAWQDDFYENVGRPCGLTRIGPGKRRLTRAEHTAEKAMEKRNREAVLLQESARRLDQKTKDEARKVAEKSQILDRDLGDGFLARRSKAKALAELTSIEIIEQERKKARAEGLESARPQFDHLREKAGQAISGLRDTNEKLSKENKTLAEENRQFSALSSDYEMRMAQTELVMSDTIEGLREVAYEGKSTKAYEKLSSACEYVHETHEDDPGVFKSLIKDVRQICKEVRENVPSVFKRFFGWTPEQKAEREAREREVERIREEAKKAARTAENRQKVERKSPSAPSPLSR